MFSKTLASPLFFSFAVKVVQPVMITENEKNRGEARVLENMIGFI